MKDRGETYCLSAEFVLHGKYKILGVINEGGMGIVYLSYDLILQQKVCIKEYFPRRYVMRKPGRCQVTVFEGEAARYFRQGVDQFVKEARILACFENLESVVEVKDFFYKNGTAYMVMKYVTGENVKQCIERSGCMESEEVLRIMRPIMSSIGEIHKKGVLHGDISPDNILITKEGEGRLIDFGTARFYGMKEGEEKHSTVFFKRGYSAEEQYSEQASQGAYTDVYGVCTTMYFMLTGISPEEAVHRMIRDHVVPLTHFPHIRMKKYKKQAIMKGMAVKAQNRYHSMEQLYHILYEKKFLFGF